MIVLCALCHREHPLGNKKEGDFIHCTCGKVFTIPPVKPYYPVVLRCATCGGSISQRSMKCDHCGGSVKPFDVSRFCDRCMAYLERDANFCSSCGSNALVASSITETSDLCCPRDGKPLMGVPIGDYYGLECHSCQGLWISKKDLDQIIKQSAEKLNPKSLCFEEKKGRQAPFTSEVQYIKCPECKESMARKNFANISGVIIDVCNKHGVWLDKFELYAVADFVRDGGLEKSVEAEREEHMRISRERAKLKDNVPKAQSDDDVMALFTSELE